MYLSPVFLSMLFELIPQLFSDLISHQSAFSYKSSFDGNESYTAVSHSSLQGGYACFVFDIKGHLRIPIDSGLHSLKRPMRAMNTVKQFCLGILGLSQ